MNRADTEHHVPLCSITDVQLRFLVPDDLTEVYIFVDKNVLRTIGYKLSNNFVVCINIF